MVESFGLSARTRNLHASPIREILAVLDRPSMVSFAGGLPAPESFPALRVDAVPPDVLQYGASEGEPELRACVAERLTQLGLRCAPEQVLILSGSQQGIDLVAKLFIDPGTVVAVESPTYLAALQVFRLFGARFESFSPHTLEPGSFAASRPALLYAIPTFQNPTGHCYSGDERDRLALASDRAGLTLFEDDPYRDLVYEDCDRTPVCARLRRARWIYQGSFSKSFAPGLRLGFLVASPELMPYLTRLKQAADLHSNRLGQWLVLRMLRDAGCAARLAQLATLYRAKRDDFESVLYAEFTDLAQWARPAGGLFYWLRLRCPIDTRRLLPHAIDQNVAFMPGEAFFAADAQLGTLRLNFTHANPAQVRRGLQTLADLIRRAPDLAI